ncbi:MAG: cytochrome c [Alphaproteobacteria bacterium]|nr:cytochrome c [Alphaproteobacteria bacterium]
MITRHENPILSDAVRMMLISWISIVVMLVAPAVHADESTGKSMAQQWCSSCHEVGHRPVTSDGAPAFKVVARRPGMTRERLRNWLSDPHPPMPNLGLARQDIEDLIDYIESLKEK